MFPPGEEIGPARLILRAPLRGTAGGIPVYETWLPELPPTPEPPPERAADLGRLIQESWFPQAGPYLQSILCGVLLACRTFPEAEVEIET
jgi:hypothetical protein